MIRYTLLWLVVFGVLAYSWKDWYRGLCGLILMMAVIEHPDMPKEILGIPGVNPWNLLMGNVLAAWLFHRKREGLHWDVPRHIVILLALYLFVVLFGFVRIIGDTEILEWYYQADMAYLINDYLVNTIKWVLPGLLLYDGCRTEERFRLAIMSVLAVYVLLGLQVAKHMPPWVALDAEQLEYRGLRVLARNVGYHRVNISAMLAGASWAILSTRVLMPVGKRWPVVLLALFVVYAQMMTGGRAGYGAWIAVGFVMSVLKWRRYLLLVPAAVAVVVMVAPGIAGRALTGFTAESRDSSQVLERLERQGEVNRGAGDVDHYTVTAGRSIAWPLIIEKIQEKPWLGYGRQAMFRSGLAVEIWEKYREAFPHPHNAYLEFAFDNGLIGAAAMLSFYALMLWYSIRMFLHKHSQTCIAIGGAATAMILSLLVSAFGSQSFYPREGWVGMWCALFLMLRVRVEYARRLSAPATAPAEMPTAVPARRPAFARAAAPVAMRPVPAKAMPHVRQERWRRRAPAGAGPAAATRRVTWQPRRSDSTVPAPASAEMTQPAIAAPAETAKPSHRFHRGVQKPVPAGIVTQGFFGKSVTDTLVWERA